jgi:hypothetical protein
MKLESQNMGSNLSIGMNNCANKFVFIDIEKIDMFPVTDDVHCGVSVHVKTVVLITKGEE